MIRPLLGAYGPVALGLGLTVRSQCGHSAFWPLIGSVRAVPRRSCPRRRLLMLPLAKDLCHTHVPRHCLLLLLRPASGCCRLLGVPEPVSYSDEEENCCKCSFRCSVASSPGTGRPRQPSAPRREEPLQQLISDRIHIPLLEDENTVVCQKQISM